LVAVTSTSSFNQISISNLMLMLSDKQVALESLQNNLQAAASAVSINNIIPLPMEHAQCTSFPQDGSYAFRHFHRSNQPAAGRGSVLCHKKRGNVNR